MESKEMIIELWGTYHLITIVAFLAILAIFGLIFKNKDSSLKEKSLIVIAFLNLAIHVLKIFLMPEYKDDVIGNIHLITFENVLNALVIMAPFILLVKNNFSRDFLFYMSLIVVLINVLYPTEMLNRNITDTDVIMFYLTNILLLLSSFYMVLFGVHALDIKRVVVVPLIFIVILGLILANEIILMESGLVDFRSNSFMEYNYRNTSFIFGPTEELKEISDQAIEPLVPDVFKKVPAGTYEGHIKYMPIMWLVVPSFVYLSVASGLVCLFFTKVLKKGNGRDF